jgi:vacuolar-type H+-ATPase subunit C/Vma6
VLTEACQQDNVTAAIEALADTALVPALQAGLKHYEDSQRLSDIEKQLNHYHLKWMAVQMVKDPLGIGVVLGYIAVKTNEVGNIRWIAHGIDLGLKVEAIRDELEIIT